MNTKIMKHIFLYSFFSLTSFLLFAQKNKKFSFEVNYGINGNFFVVSPDYGGPGGPISAKFYNKNFIGPIGGAEIKYKLSKHSGLGLAFAKSVNSKKINYSGRFINVGISDWSIKHTNKFFQLFYERDFSKKNPPPGFVL